MPDDARVVALWTISDCLREYRRNRLWWAMHGTGPGLDESLRDWWDRQ